MTTLLQPEVPARAMPFVVANVVSPLEIGDVKESDPEPAKLILDVTFPNRFIASRTRLEIDCENDIPAPLLRQPVKLDNTPPIAPVVKLKPIAALEWDVFPENVPKVPSCSPNCVPEEAALIVVLLVNVPPISASVTQLPLPVRMKMLPSIVQLVDVSAALIWNPGPPVTEAKRYVTLFENTAVVSVVLLLTTFQ
mgnify:CR=1 FL=1